MNFSQLYRDEGIVLRTHKIGEADRIITLLTKTHGKVRAVAKGVRRTQSRVGARVEPFNHIDVQLRKSSKSKLETLTQVETVAPYASLIIDDYQLYTFAQAMAETCDKLTLVEEEPVPALFRLLEGAINALGRRKYEPTLVLDAFLLRAMAIAGYAPSFSACSQCGRAGTHQAFSISGGGAVCTDCAHEDLRYPSPEVFVLLGSLLAGDWQSAAQVDRSFYKRADDIAKEYAQWHLEKRLKSLQYLEQ